MTLLIGPGHKVQGVHFGTDYCFPQRQALIVVAYSVRLFILSSGDRDGRLHLGQWSTEPQT